MEMFEKILVPLDGSPLAQAILPYVMVVAKGFHSRVILFHVAETALDLEAPEQKTYADETMERIRPLAENYLAGVADEFRREAIDVQTKVVEGRAAAQIVEHAEQENVGLIAMSTHGRSGLARLVMGSGIDKILRACEQPILLVRPRDEGASGEAAGRLSKIIVPLDGSNAAEAAIPFAEELAKALGLEIILIQVMSVETGPGQATQGQGPNGAVGGIARRAGPQNCGVRQGDSRQSGGHDHTRSLRLPPLGYGQRGRRGSAANGRASAGDPSPTCH